MGYFIYRKEKKSSTPEENMRKTERRTTACSADNCVRPRGYFTRLYIMYNLYRRVVILFDRVKYGYQQTFCRKISCYNIYFFPISVGQAPRRREKYKILSRPTRGEGGGKDVRHDDDGAVAGYQINPIACIKYVCGV